MVIDSMSQLHRDVGPAIIRSNGSMYWYYHGQLHKILDKLEAGLVSGKEVDK